MQTTQFVRNAKKFTPLWIVAFLLVMQYRANTSATSQPLCLYDYSLTQPIGEEYKLEPTLSRISGASLFELKLKNVGIKPVAVLRWYALYEVRLFDASGRQISDQAGYFSRITIAHHPAWDWMILKPNETVSFPLKAYAPKAGTAIPKEARWADCRIQDSWLEFEPPPAIAERARAKVVGFKPTQRIRINH